MTNMTEAKRLRAGDYVQGENLGENWVIGRVIKADKSNGSVRVYDQDANEHILTIGETYKATKAEYDNFNYKEEPVEEDDIKASEEGPKDEPTDDEAPVEERESSAGRAWINNQQKPFHEPRLVKRGKNEGKLEVKYQRSATKKRKKIFIPVEHVIEWYIDSEAILNNPKDETPDDDRVRIKPDWSRYTVQETKTASGRRVINNGDEVAALLEGLCLDDAFGEVAHWLVKIEGSEEAVPDVEDALRKKYQHLNDGMQRMNIGNRLRAAMKRNGIESLGNMD